MSMNRRNVLIGLGAVAAGGGAVLGSGAFSQVQAERTVSVTTAGDASGFLQLSGDGSYVTDDSSGALTLDLGQATSGDGFNEEARTVVEGIVTATNNAADGENIDIGFDDGTGTQVAETTLNFGDGSGVAVAQVTLYWGTESSRSVQSSVGSSSSAQMGAVVDTRSGSNGDASDGTSASASVLALDSDGS